MESAAISEIQCAWCSTINPLGDSCKNCGGPLPRPPGPDPGPEPPPAPRQIPAKYKSDLLYWKNLDLLGGLGFVLLFFWTILFLLLGLWMMRRGRRTSLAQIAALERGESARAEITAIRKEAAGNGRRWVITYSFPTPDGPQKGEVHGWSGVHIRRRVGDPIWVVYLPEDPSKNALWPPIK